MGKLRGERLTPSPEVHLLVPGSLAQRTGGYIYDARMATGLRALGWRVMVHELEGSFPLPDDRARESVEKTLSTIPDGTGVIVDGLALPGLAQSSPSPGHRLRLLALVHHLTSDETGLKKHDINELYSAEITAIESCQGVIVTSKFTARRLGSLGIPPESIRTVVPGTDPVAWGTDVAARAVNELLCVGSVTRRKGQDVLIRALARLSQRPWSCVIAGSVTRDAPFAEAVRRASREAGVAQRVRFTGELDRSQLELLYRRSSVFVLPSYYEGFGMAITEALSWGLPVVATTAGAIPDTLPGNAGILVPPGNDEALAEAIDRLLDEPAPGPGDAPVESPVRLEMSAEARRHGAELPDWNRQVERFGEAILSLLPKPS